MTDTPVPPITDADLDAVRRLVDSRPDLCHIGLRRDTVRALIARIDTAYDAGFDDGYNGRW